LSLTDINRLLAITVADFTEIRGNTGAVGKQMNEVVSYDETRIISYKEKKVLNS